MSNNTQVSPLSNKPSKRKRALFAVCFGSILAFIFVLYQEYYLLSALSPDEISLTILLDAIINRSLSSLELAFVLWHVSLTGLVIISIPFIILIPIKQRIPYTLKLVLLTILVFLSENYIYFIMGGIAYAYK